MYMGVILSITSWTTTELSIPHVYGGDPINPTCLNFSRAVFPMYMGVILTIFMGRRGELRIPHVYGGDP